MRNVSDRTCRENQTTLSYTIMFLENFAVYEIVWENNVELDRPQMTIWRIRDASWILWATNTHSGYVMYVAFPLQ